MRGHLRIIALQRGKRQQATLDVGNALAALAFCSLLLPPVLAGQESRHETTDEQRLWVSRSDSLQALSSEITGLYYALKKADALPTAKHQNEKGHTVEQLLRTEELYFGAAFPKPMDALACSLNRNHCHPESDSTDPGGMSFRWTHQAGEEIVLPSISFEIGYGHILYEKKAGDQVSELIVKTLGGCKTFDASCRERVGSMNNAGVEVLKAEYVGPVWLPTLQVRTRLDLSKKPQLLRDLDRNLIPLATVVVPKGDITEKAAVPREESSPKPELGSRHTDSSRETDASASRAAFGDAVRAPSATSDLSPTLNALSIPDRNEIDPSSQRALQSMLDERGDMARDQQIVFDLISAPGPDELTSRFEPVVAVLDTLVDAAHCAFGDRVSANNLDEEEIIRLGEADRTRCGVPVPANRTESSDHGTHVTGLIVAKAHPAEGNAKLRGLNPSARVETFQLQINSDEFDIAAATQRLLLAARRIPKVINASFYYVPREGQNDTFAAELKRLLKHTLVVAAAGNSGMRHAGPCVPLPACLDFANVISVAALDLSPNAPEPLPDSDFGPRVDIGVPALDVPSTVRANGIARLRGTSQAAPLVAAAASLIYARNPSLAPLKVRNRLIYSSDLLPSLKDDLRGGRLNVRRAIDFEDDLVTLAPGADILGIEGTSHVESEITLRGSIERLGPESDQMEDMTFKIQGVGRPEGRLINFRLVRRMLIDPTAIQRYTFMIEDEESGELVRQSAALNSGGRWVFMMVRDSKTGSSKQVRFQMKHIRDFISGMQ
ncbi:MAG TPA: S8/S53 family peptidase [Thermoanaerobaculia bacterium]|nr:S8/S53 family peptidase [Thermoanaerobaculia bacterium]